MKLALATYALNVGGMESFIFHIAEDARRRGHDVALAITQSIGAWHERAVEAGFQTLALLPGKLESRAHHARRVARALAGFDLLVLNHCREAQAALGLLPDSTGALSVLHNDFPGIYDVGLGNAGNLDHVVCVSSRIRDESIRRGFPSEKLSLVPYGIDVPPARQRPTPAGDASNPPNLRIVFLGRITHEQKGVLDIPPILAPYALHECQRSIDFIGDGPDLPALQAAMRATCPNVQSTYHGALPHQRAMEILASADVLLMPSRYEGFPIALLEAMARGVVPVASNLAGIAEAIEDRTTGLLAAPGDVVGFAEALMQVANPQVRTRMSQEAWSRASRLYRREVMCDRLAEIFERVHSIRRSPSRKPHTGSLDPLLVGRGGHLPRVLREALAKRAQSRALAK